MNEIVFAICCCSLNNSKLPQTVYPRVREVCNLNNTVGCWFMCKSVIGQNIDFDSEIQRS